MISDYDLIVFFLKENQFGFYSFKKQRVENQLYWILSSVLTNKNTTSELTIVLPVIWFLLFIPFPGGKKIVYTPSQSTNREKYSN